MNQLRYFFGLHIPKRVPSNAVATCGNNTGDRCIRKRYFKSRILKNVQSDNFLRRSNFEVNEITKITTSRYHDNPKSNSRSLIRVKSKTGQFEIARKSKSTKIQNIARHNKKASQSNTPRSTASSLSQVSTLKSDTKNRTYSKNQLEKSTAQESKNETLLLTTEKYPRSYAKLIANYAEELRTNPNDESRSTSNLSPRRYRESQRLSQARRSKDVLGSRREGSSTSSTRVSTGPRDSEKYSEWLGDMEATLRGLKSHAKPNEGAKIMKDTKFDEAEVLEFVDRNADWLDDVVAAHVAQKKPKPMTNKNELGSVAKSARGFATKSEITSDKKLTVGDRTIHPDSIPAKREYLLEYLAGETSGTNFKIKMKPANETNIGSEVSLRLGPSGSRLSVNLKESSVDINLESLNDTENMKNVSEIQDSYYNLSKAKLRDDFKGKDLDKQNTGSSMYITVNEEQPPTAGTSGSVKQIEIRINGKAATEVKTASLKINEVDVVSSVDNVEIVLPTFARGKKGFLKKGERQGSVLNLQISSGPEKSVEIAVKGVSPSGSAGPGAANTGSIGSRGNTAGSSSGGSKPGSKDPKMSHLQHDSKNNPTVIRITSRVLPWWASPDSFRFTRDSGGTSGSGPTEAGKAPSRSQSTNQVDRSRKLSDNMESSVANDKKPSGKSIISRSQSHGNIVEKTKMVAVNEKTDSQQKLTAGSISRRRSQIRNGISTGRGRSRKRRRSASAITKIIKNEIKKKNDRISAKVNNAMSRKDSGLNISKKQENFGHKKDGLKSSQIVGTNLKKTLEKMDTTGNVGGKKFIDTSDVTSKIQMEKKTPVISNRVKPQIVEKLEASKTKSMKTEGSKMADTHNVTSTNLNKKSEGVSGVSTLSGGQTQANMKMTDKVKVKTDKKLDSLSSSDSKKVEVKKNENNLQNYAVNKGKSSGSTDPAVKATKPSSSGSMQLPETRNKKKFVQNINTNVQLSNVGRTAKTVFEEKAKSAIFAKNDKDISKMSRTSPSKVISRKDTKMDITTGKSSKEKNPVKMESQKNIPKISSYVKSNILSKENMKKHQSHLATSTIKDSKSNFNNTAVKSSESKLRVNPLKPISKKDDGTLIDYGLKVMSRKKSKKGLNESKVFGRIGTTALNKSINKKIDENHSGIVEIQKTEISKNKGKTYAVERKASLIQIPRLKIVLEPMKKVSNIAKENESTHTQISRKDEKMKKDTTNFSNIPKSDSSAKTTTNETAKGSRAIKKYAARLRQSAASKIAITKSPETSKKPSNNISKNFTNPEATKITISKNSHDPSISQNDVRPEKELLYAIWLERFDRKTTKDKITKSKPPKT